MMTEKDEEDIFNEHKAVIFTKCVFQMKMIFDKSGTLKDLRKTYLDVEGTKPDNSIKLKKWFFDNFEPTADGWVQKKRWMN